MQKHRVLFSILLTAILGLTGDAWAQPCASSVECQAGQDCLNGQCVTPSFASPQGPQVSSSEGASLTSQPAASSGSVGDICGTGADCSEGLLCLSKRCRSREAPSRVGVFFRLDPQLTDKILDSDSMIYAVGIDYSPGGELWKYHFITGIRVASYATNATVSPLSFGIGFPFYRSGGFALEAEILVHFLRLDIPFVSINGSGITELGSGFGVQMVASFSDRFFVAVEPASLHVRYLAIGGGGINTSVGTQFPIALTAGIEF